MRFLFLIILIGLCTPTNGQRRISTKQIYTEGEIKLRNGEIYSCEIGFPIYNGADAHAFNIKRSRDQIYIFTKVNGEVKKVRHKDIAELKARSGDQEIVLRYEEVFRYPPRSDEKKSYGFQYWLDLKEGCDHIKGYHLVYRYDLTKKGELIALYQNKIAEYVLWTDGGDFTIVGLDDIKHKPQGRKKWNKERKKKLERYLSEFNYPASFLKDKKAITPAELTEYINSECQK